MKSSINSLVALFILIVTFGVSPLSEAINVPPHSAEYSIKPVGVPKGPGLVELELAVLPKYSDEIFLKDDGKYTELEIRITEFLNLHYSGDTVWTVKVDSGVWYRKILNVIIPPNDTSGLRFSIKCGRVPNPGACYFVTKSDTVDVYKGHPRTYASDPQVQSNDPIIDTMTEAQLQTKYEVVVELKDSPKLKFVEKLVGDLADSNLFDANRKHYKLWITLQDLIKIGKNGIEFDFVTPPPWDRRLQPSRDSTFPGLKKTDSTQPRGAFPNSDSKLSTELVGGISLDHVDGATPGGTGISIGPTIRFHLRLNNNSGNILDGLTNAFKLYSPDGALWQPPDNSNTASSASYTPPFHRRNSLAV